MKIDRFYPEATKIIMDKDSRSKTLTSFVVSYYNYAIITRAYSTRNMQ